MLLGRLQRDQRPGLLPGRALPPRGASDLNDCRDSCWNDLIGVNSGRERVAEVKRLLRLQSEGPTLTGLNFRREQGAKVERLLLLQLEGTAFNDLIGLNSGREQVDKVKR